MSVNLWQIGMKTFKAWLRQRLGDNDPVGDLARDALSARSEWRGHTELSLRQNMNSHGACNEALATLIEATKRYRNEL